MSSVGVRRGWVGQVREEPCGLDFDVQPGKPSVSAAGGT